MNKGQHCMALLAHVDAGKTTLSESILFNTGAIRKAGRVDHRDSFLDTEAQERERGITIFSKQALFNIGGNSYTLIDTPGHTDFSAETERVLSVLDFAVLIISAPDGIHGHDLTLWRLLKTYKVPTLIFVNKLDQPGADAAAVLRELKSRFGSSCVDFTALRNEVQEPLAALPDAAGLAFKGKNIHGNASSATTHTGAYFSFADSYEREAFFEAIAELDETAMEHYFEDGEISQAEIIRLFKERKLYPVLFGSALKNEGVDKLLTLIDYLCADAECIQHLSGEGAGTAADNVKAGSPGLASDINESDAAKAAVSTNQGTETFAAKIFKITHDNKGGRLVHIRITGGELKPKDIIRVNHRDKRAASDEKVNRILLYSGQSFEQLERAETGMVVCLDGMASALPGDTLGGEPVGQEMLMAALFASKVSSPDVPDAHKLYQILKELEPEIPEISLGFNERLGEITLKLMGEVQTDIIRAIVKERYDIRLEFSESSIVYKETLSEPVVCAGHFEPLRHYAEVHLLLEPIERGSGIEFCSRLSTDVLSRNYQRQILSELAAKKHVGALLGAELTDIRISLINGRAHEKHTEGGDFREAAWRAVRYGAAKARAEGKALLLEPYYEFSLRVPDKNVGRAMNDLAAKAEHFEGPETEGGMAVFTGRAAVSDMRDYAAEVTAYTGGFGSLELSFGGYGTCRKAEDVVDAAGYEPELDIDNPSGSVFCSHGAGYYVPWYEAGAYFHLDLGAEERYLEALLREADAADSGDESMTSRPGSGTVHGSASGASADGAAVPKNSGIRVIKHYDLSAYKDYGNDSPANVSGTGLHAGSSKAGEGTKRGDNAKTDYMGAGLERDKELEEIFYRSLGGNRGRNPQKALERAQRQGDAVRKRPENNSSDGTGHVEIREARKQYLLVDGYNIIFSWPELNEMSKTNIDGARLKLMDILANYQGYRGMTLILVFDAYKVKGNHGSVEKYHNIYVVYTREAQTADAYIEKTVHEIGKKERVTVATSDGLEQTIVFGEGAVRMSSRELYEEVELALSEMRKNHIEKAVRVKNVMDLPDMKMSSGDK